MNNIIRSGIAVAGIAGALLSSPIASAQTTSVNTGSVGASANGTNSENVILDLPGAIAAGGDLAVGYGGGANTLIPFTPALNPAHTAPFTVEFWALPTDFNSVVGPSPVFNRVSAGDRSGWVFFQRVDTTGWDFRMYSGTGDQVGFELEGGTSTLDSWSHVVATFDGTAPLLYVNGVLADSSWTGSGVYRSNQGGAVTPPLSIGAYDNGENPFTGSVDDFAFYHTALTPAQILAHYNTAFSATPGAYSSLVKGDGAVVYLQNIPEPSTAGMLLVGLLGAGGLKRHRRPARK